MKPYKIPIFYQLRGQSYMMPAENPIDDILRWITPSVWAMTPPMGVMRNERVFACMLPGQSKAVPLAFGLEEAADRLASLVSQSPLPHAPYELDYRISEGPSTQALGEQAQKEFGLAYQTALKRHSGSSRKALLELLTEIPKGMSREEPK